MAEITGFCARAIARYGADGDVASSDAEVLILNSSGSGPSTRRVWDIDTSDGIDSGLVSVAYSANPGGGLSGISWSVAGGATDPLVYTGSTYGTVTSIKIRARVAGSGLRMGWSDIIVKFYRTGSLTQTKTIASVAWPVANTLGETSGTPAENTLTVNPTATNNDKVVVSAKIRLQADLGVVPLPNDIIGEIFLFAAGCAIT